MKDQEVTGLSLAAASLSKLNCTPTVGPPKTSELTSSLQHEKLEKLKA